MGKARPSSPRRRAETERLPQVRTSVPKRGRLSCARDLGPPAPSRPHGPARLRAQKLRGGLSTSWEPVWRPAWSSRASAGPPWLLSGPVHELSERAREHYSGGPRHLGLGGLRSGGGTSQRGGAGPRNENPLDAAPGCRRPSRCPPEGGWWGVQGAPCPHTVLAARGRVTRGGQDGALRSFVLTSLVAVPGRGTNATGRCSKGSRPLRGPRAPSRGDRAHLPAACQSLLVGD